MTERLRATYRVETPLPLEKAAALLAAEQSTGTFTEVPGETAELKDRFAARVEQVTYSGSVDQPSLPGGSSPSADRYARGEIVVSWPCENFGCNLPTLVSTIQGNLYELAQFSGVKLVSLQLPSAWARDFRGPNFGVAGTRRLTGVADRPLIGTIIKPSIGLSPDETAGLVATLVEAGIDFIKDDELMANPPHSPLEERVAAVMRVVNDEAERTGRKVMVAFNITDELDAMRRHYDVIVRHGGTAAMVSLNSVGLVAVKQICDLGRLAIHGHRNGWGMLNRHPMLGVEFAAWQKLWRLAGVDQIHVNGLGNKFWEPDESVVRSIRSCTEPLFAGESSGSTSARGDCPADGGVLPVVSSGQWGGQAFETYRQTRTVDLLYLAGGGVLAHPDGPVGGVRALRQAWEAAVEGLSLSQAAERHLEFRVSVEKFAS